MNYILVKMTDAGKRFPFAKQISDGRIVLPSNYIKVLAGAQVEIVSEQQALALIYGEEKAAEMVEEQTKVETITETKTEKKGK